MSLSTLQILALQSFPGIGTKSVLKAGNFCKYCIDDKDLQDVLAKCSIKMKGSDGKKVSISAFDIRRSLDHAERLIEKSVSMGIKVISYYETAFPQILRDTKSEDGKKSDPPVVLFYKGNLEALKMPGLAVIGTRESTVGAVKAGEYLSCQFAWRGFCIVSGLALGCDTAGHRGCLDSGGKTIAFLAHGLDSVYPPQNIRLAEEIVAKGGLLLSEYPIGTPVSKFSLVARDRLQTGASLATIVIQTGENGGTMHAAKATYNSGKPLYVLKYTDRETDEHKKTKGNHLLAKKYSAKYISGKDNLDYIANDILSSMKKYKIFQESLLV